jgi:hypothetical protein
MVRRRLPVVQNAPAPTPEDDEQRPPLHWVGFGTVAIFSAWLPLTYVAGMVSARIMTSMFGSELSRDALDGALGAMPMMERARLMAVVALPVVFALGLAAFGGGFVVGRFGSGTGVREGAWAGVATAAIATAMAWSGAIVSSVVSGVVTLAVAATFAAWGAKVGVRRRPR